MSMEAKKEPALDEGQPKVLGMLAEFETPEQLIEAARRTREEGYEHFDAHSPYPIHALDEAMKIKPAAIPWLVLIAGMTGTGLAVLMQWWTNAVDYQFIISGKPFFSLPANIPIMFEVTILLAALTAFFTQIFFNRLGRPSNPLFESERFRRATIDRFFLHVEARGYKFDRVETKSFLEGLGAKAVEPVLESAAERDDRLPRPIVVSGVVMASLAVLPLLFFVRQRYGTFDRTRIHVVQDMDFQAKYKAQAENDFFTDGRANRLPVEGTVARGVFLGDIARTLGKTSDGDWVDEFPIPVNEENLLRGQERYRITCVLCHGEGGDGNGLVAQRATTLMESGKASWVAPTSIHDPNVLQQPIGQLFNSITNGVRNMPAYGSQISIDDRWRILMYVKALQRARTGTPEDLPAGFQEENR
jgi:mono/diheme cytochrome c family protein